MPSARKPMAVCWRRWRIKRAAISTLPNRWPRPTKPKKSPKRGPRKKMLRRGATVGAIMADWAQATVFWPTNVTWPSRAWPSLPEILTPAAIGSRHGSDRCGRQRRWPRRSKSKLNSLPTANRLNCNGRPPRKTAATATPTCRKSCRLAKADDGITLPSVGTAGLAETGRIVEAGVDGLTDLAERAVATGDCKPPKSPPKPCSLATLATSKPKRFNESSRSSALQAKPVVQATPAAPAPAAAPAVPPQAADANPAPAAAPSNDLNLVRATGGAAAAIGRWAGPGTSHAAGLAAPAAGSLTDQFAAKAHCSMKFSSNAASSAKCCGARSRTPSSMPARR